MSANLEAWNRARWHIIGMDDRPRHLRAVPLWADVIELLDGSYRWEVGGYGGSRHGHAPSRRAAMVRARQAVRDELRERGVE